MGTFDLSLPLLAVVVWGARQSLLAVAACAACAWPAESQPHQMGELMGFRRKHRAARDFGVFLPCLGSCTPSTQIDDVVSLGSFVGPITPQQSRQPQHSFDVLDKQASHFHGNRSCLRATKTLRATDRHKPANQAKSRLPPLVSPATAYPEARCPVAARKQDGISSNSIRFLETAGKIGRHKRPLSTDRLLERKGEEEDHEDCNQLGRPALVPVAWPACFGRVA